MSHMRAINVIFHKWGIVSSLISFKVLPSDMPKYWAWLVDPRDVRRTSRASLLDIMQPLCHVSCHLGRNLHRLSEVHAVISQYFLTSDPPHAQTGCGLYPSLPSFLHPPSPYTFSPGIRIANVWLSAFLYRPSPLTPIHSMGWCGRERVHVSAGGATAQRPFATKLVTGQYPYMLHEDEEFMESHGLMTLIVDINLSCIF